MRVADGPPHLNATRNFRVDSTRVLAFPPPPDATVRILNPDAADSKCSLGASNRVEASQTLISQMLGPYR